MPLTRRDLKKKTKTKHQRTDFQNQGAPPSTLLLTPPPVNLPLACSTPLGLKQFYLPLLQFGQMSRDQRFDDPASLSSAFHLYLKKKKKNPTRTQFSTSPCA